MNKKCFLFFLETKIFLFLAIITVFFSCRHDDEKASWQTEIVTPLFKSSLGINDIISDTLVQTDSSDNSLMLVYENHLYDMTLDSLFNLYDTSVTKIYNLDSISLYDQSISYPVTLGQICLNAGIVGALIISQNGNTVPIPAISPISSAPFIINADTLFTTMTLISGFIDISIQNGFPIDMTNVSFDLKNTSNGSSIGTATFPLIAAGTTESQTISLAGKTVEGNMTAQILSMSSPGSNGIPVLVDTSDALLATLKIHDLHPSTATALFPTQNLIDKSQPFYFHFDSVQLKEAKIKSGQVVMDLYSTLQDSVHFTYSLPSATLNGVTFEVTKTLPPAPAGGPPSHFNQAYDFSNYHLDLANLPQDTVNTMYNTFLARVDSTGQMRTLSLTDSMYANIGFVSLTPSYARGYLGQQIFSIGPSQLGVDIFKNISGNLQLQDVKLKIVAENGIGADARATISNLSSYNSGTNTTVTLTGSGVTNPINITRATDNGGMPPVNVSITTFQLDNSNTNSTASAFISNLPDKLNYSMILETNPNGNVSNWTDFIYVDKLMEFNLDVEMPLSFKANDLTLSDTIDFSLNQTDISRIKDGTLTLISDNGFPFEANIKLYLLDLSGHVTDSTFFPNIVISAAPVDANNKVKEKKQTKTDIQVNEQKINTLFTIQKMKVIAKFNTFPANSFLKIYSDYKIDFQMTGDFNYLAN